MIKFRYINLGLLGIFSVALMTMYQNCAEPFGASSDVLEMSDFNLSEVDKESTFETQQNSISSSSASGLTHGQLIAALKYQSCMFNSLVYPQVEDDSNNISMLKRSGCVALPRAIETWTTPPQFSQVSSKIQKIKSLTGKSYVYGMFIAEAISTTAIYSDDSGRRFNFAAMCASGSIGTWGPNTCVPTTTSAEYIRYLRYIVGKGLAVGIQDFLFGQTDYLDSARLLPPLIQEFRALAAASGRVAIFGQQPNQIPPESYLKSFDYVVGPSHVDAQVDRVCRPDSPSNYCIAVLFHPDVAKKAHHVVIELDWYSGDDDIHRFARKLPADRLRFLRTRFEQIDRVKAGMVLPFRTPLNGGSTHIIGGKPVTNCHGVNQFAYSANALYSCKDEGMLNQLLAERRSLYLGSPTTPAPTPAKLFVEGLYTHLLGRTADSAGLNFHTNRVATVGAAQVALDIVRSAEATSYFSKVSSSDFVKRAYRGILQREPDPSGLEYYTLQITRGTKTKLAVATELINSDEFRRRWQ